MIELVPLLQTQRDLYDLPRSIVRFRTYIETLTDEHGEMDLPLSAMNPMGHEHNAELMDALLAMDAEGVAESAVAEANQRLAKALGNPATIPALRVAVVVADDLRGQWTNRHFSEASHRFDARGTARRNWATVLCWTSESWTPQQIYQETLAVIFRTLYTFKLGFPKRLSSMLMQEGLAMHFARMESPLPDKDDLEYSRDVVLPLLESEEFPTIFGVFYGDEAAKSVGYQPIGLSERAGFAVALAMATELDILPEEKLA